MRCEICGKEIRGRPLRTKIEGSLMNTCQECSRFGKVQREPPRKTKKRFTARSLRREKPSYEVIEEYSSIIREAREKKGWSRENLAEKVFEKVSVIHRLESGRMIPDLKLARKIENILNVKLLEKIEDILEEEISARSVRGATIGDIARIKRNK